MHLHAALVPPVTVRQALFDLVAGQQTRGLDVIPAERLILPITAFGYLASGDARRLVDALDRVCSELPPGPTVEVSGGSALVDPDDRSVWAELSTTDEDLDTLRTIARTVVSGVEPLGFFCDRRQFRPRLDVATINDATTVEDLEQVLAALSAYRSEPWTVTEVAILQRGSGVWRTVQVGG